MGNKKLDKTIPGDSADSDLDIFEGENDEPELKLQSGKGKFDYYTFFLAIAVFSLPLSVIFFPWDASDLSDSRSASQEELLQYGGTQKEYRRTAERRNTRVMELKRFEDRELAKYKQVLVFTNDTTGSSRAILDANVPYEEPYDNPYNPINDRIGENMDVIESIEFFFNHVDSLGTNIYFESTKLKREFRITNFNNLDTITKYKVIQCFYYTPKERGLLINRLNNNGNPASFIVKSKEERIKEIRGLQVSSCILTEDELRNQKIETSLRALFAPHKAIDPATDLFYITCYNKQMDKELFEEKVEKIKTMFFTEESTINGEFREVKLVKY